MCFVLFLLEFFFIYLLVFGHKVAYGILVLLPGFESTPLAARAKTPKGGLDHQGFPYFYRILYTCLITFRTMTQL